MNALITLIDKGGALMWPLLFCSLIVWMIVFERAWRYRGLNSKIKYFHLEARNAIFQNDVDALRKLCQSSPLIPTSILLVSAMDLKNSKDERVRLLWRKSVERRRSQITSQLKSGLWILGTIASAAPFIGLAGTVIGILQSFGQIAQTGKTGFDVVAGGISEALIATAGGIVVAVIALFAYNVFQNLWSRIVLEIKYSSDELLDLFGEEAGGLHSNPR